MQSVFARIKKLSSRGDEDLWELNSESNQDVRVKELTCQKSNKSVSEAEKSESSNLNESLILAQDERWRRA